MPQSHVVAAVALRVPAFVVNVFPYVLSLNYLGARLALNGSDSVREVM